MVPLPFTYFCHMVMMVSACESTIFPFVINKSLAGIGTFLKSPPSASHVCPGLSWRMRKCVKMDGEVENVFIMKSYLSMEGVKLDVQIGSRERERH